MTWSVIPLLAFSISCRLKDAALNPEGPSGNVARRCAAEVRLSNTLIEYHLLQKPEGSQKSGIEPAGELWSSVAAGYFQPDEDDTPSRKW
jgi:hypothetical protein